MTNYENLERRYLLLKSRPGQVWQDLAAKLERKIINLPVEYLDREYVPNDLVTRAIQQTAVEKLADIVLC